MALTDKLTAIADAIRAKTGGTTPLTLAQMPTEIAAIQTGGGGDNPLDYACSLYGMFYGVTFPSGTELKLSFGSKAGRDAFAEALKYCFRDTKGVKSIKVISTIAAPTSIDMNSLMRCSNNETELERADFSEAQQLLVPKDFGAAFQYRKALKEVLGEFDLSNCSSLNGAFTQCTALETICFKAGTIKKSLSFAATANLTDETIQSIIDGLADLTGGTAQTLTLHATVGAKLTDAQKSAASAKNWTISY